jgi:probable rRNA maturation factor
MPIEVVLEDAGWKKVDIVGLASGAFHSVMEHFDLDPEICEVEILACNDERIAALNFGFRGIEKSTNVLSWPSVDRSAECEGQYPPKSSPDHDGFMGDIAISYDTCLSEATEAGKNINHHVSHLMVHAVLHLMGFDHENDKDAVLMETIEVEILGKMGIDSPYEE